MNHAIHSEQLTRSFGRLPAVEGLDLRVPEGAISAFLGPNGAGKTTTIRMLLGLLKPTRGTCEVLGYHPGHPDALRQLGAMVESPSLYGHLTGFENLEITRLMRGLPKTETERVLKVVNLTADAARIVQQYSLGMRQRLALALALLGTPRLLVLDEPTNGLDPSGIQEIRELIRRVPKEVGASVFLSSHMLAEVEQIASHLVVIHKGTLRFQGPMETFGAPEIPRIQLRVDDPTRALLLLQQLGLAATQEGPFLLVPVSECEVPGMVSALVQGGSAIYELSPQRHSLEARFLALVEGA